MTSPVLWLLRLRRLTQARRREGSPRLVADAEASRVQHAEVGGRRGRLAAHGRGARRSYRGSEREVVAEVGGEVRSVSQPPLSVCLDCQLAATLSLTEHSSGQ